MNRRPFQGLRTKFVDPATGNLTEYWQRNLAQIQLNPAGGVVIPFSATPTFDASVASLFDITLSGHVTSSAIVNTQPGQVVTFIIAQDGTGNWTFAWPTNVKNATAPNPAANSVSVQSFIARSDGNLYPTGPATYN